MRDCTHEVPEAGRRFVIRQRVASKLNGSWDYSIDGQVLWLTTDDLHEVSLFYKSTPRGSFIGQTAMGVKFRIEKLTRPRWCSGSPMATG